MTTDPHEHNPYCAPLASLEHIADATGEAVHHRFRWRIIPVTMLYVWGGSWIFVAVLGTVHMFAWFAIRIHRGEMARFPWAASVLIGSITVAAFGFAFIVAGRSLWTSHWVRGGLAVLVTLILYVLFTATGGRLLAL